MELKNAWMYPPQAGGVSREWFTLLGEQLFASDLGLFTSCGAGDMTYQINHQVLPDDTSKLDLYSFVGRLLGKALLEDAIVDAHLALPLYKHILGLPIRLRDLKNVDDGLYTKIKYMSENNIEGVLYDVFASEIFVDGKVHYLDLVENGRNVEVNDENKERYIQLLVKWRLMGSIEAQIEAILKALYEVVPPRLISVFTFQELELMLCGLPYIDTEDWEESARYSCPELIDKDTEVAKWFWEVVREFSPDVRARLLQFSTGTARVPVGGFSSMKSHSGELCPFTICGVDAKTRAYPESRTCFNRILLPTYTSKLQLRQRLLVAIEMEMRLDIE